MLSALLRQPGGCEGVLPAGEVPHMTELPVAEVGEDTRQLLFHRNRGARYTSGHLEESNDRIAGVAKLVKLEAEVADVLQPALASFRKPS